jgi:predicted dehydrogenase
VLPPAPQHAFFVRAAIAAGKDVYCAENFSHILAIYGGHFMDMLFHVVGAPLTLAAIVKDQFPSVTLIETGETFPNTTPDQVVVIGTLANGAIFSIQIEGGKRNNSGLQIDITGMEGDLKVSNELAFQSSRTRTTTKSKDRKETAKPSVSSRYPLSTKDSPPPN